MSSEFKVGDKVRVLAGGEGVVTYGPFNSTFDTYKMYVVKQDGDDERAFKNVDLSPLPAFAVGDKVTSGLAEYTLHAGPFTGRFGDHFWVLERPDGTHVWARADSLTKVEAPALVPVGTRVRVDRAKYAENIHGEVGAVTSNTATFAAEDDDRHRYRVELGRDAGFVYAAEVTPVDESADGFKYEGVTYKYGVPYTDCDGDTWTFERPTRAGAAPKSDSNSYRIGESLAYVVDNYRPLTTD
ncbi:phiSA1p31-related protein [Streptomyces californicus]|uniref:phiSA1p31-related protein n=1 Tax=Streptomyces californicus TaxID=67351 RepID=UPI0004C1E359|nr:phiSA1p31-related protein [Streptomyces californicus]QRV53473.1 phiSA1p31-related protein [Streptomyces californicus]